MDGWPPIYTIGKKESLLLAGLAAIHLVPDSTPTNIRGPPTGESQGLILWRHCYAGSWAAELLARYFGSLSLQSLLVSEFSNFFFFVPSGPGSSLVETLRGARPPGKPSGLEFEQGPIQDQGL